MSLSMYLFSVWLVWRRWTEALRDSYELRDVVVKGSDGHDLKNPGYRKGKILLVVAMSLSLEVPFSRLDITSDTMVQLSLCLSVIGPNSWQDIDC